MLDGLEVSILNFSKLKTSHRDIRYDSEFYLKRFVASGNHLLEIKTEKISTSSKVSGGNAYKSEAFGKEGVKIATITDVNQKTDLDNWNTISIAEYLKFSPNELVNNSILLGGTHHNYWDLGKVIFIRNIKPNEIRTFNQRTFSIKFNSIIPQFGFIALRTSIVRNQIERLGRGNNQLNLSNFDLGNILIPILSKEFQKTIKVLVDKAFIKKDDFKYCFFKAKELLLQKIGLQNFESKETNNYQEISLSKSFISTKRLDAEYYHPKPLFLIDQLKKKEYYLVKELFDIGNGYAWKSKYFKEQGEGEPFVRIRNCKPGYIENKNLTTLDSDYAKAEEVEKAKKNDIVIGMDGIRYFYGSLIKEPVYVNQRVCHLTPKENSKIDSELVLMIINSVIGQTQLMREMTIAQTVGHITNVSVGNLIIPKLDEKIRNEVSKKIKESHQLEKESLHLLEVAKKAVEIAIEQNEEIALGYINKETTFN